MKKLFLGTALVFTVSGFVSGAFCADMNNQFQKDFSGDIRHLRVQIDSGRVNVVSGSGGMAAIRATTSFPTCVTRMELVDGTLQVENLKAKGGCDCSYDIVVPKSTTVNIHAGSAEVAIRDLESALCANIGSGSLEVKKMGSVNVDGGSINTSVSDVDGDISVKTGSGSLKVGFRGIPSQARNIVYESGSGNLEVSLPQDSLVKSTPSSSSFPYLSKFSSDFSLVDIGYNFFVRWSFGRGSAELKKNLQ
jgi:hypothetical protein